MAFSGKGEICNRFILRMFMITKNTVKFRLSMDPKKRYVSHKEE